MNPPAGTGCPKTEIADPDCFEELKTSVSMHEQPRFNSLSPVTSPVHKSKGDQRDSCSPLDKGGSEISEPSEPSDPPDVDSEPQGQQAGQSRQTTQRKQKSVGE